jgi:histidinol-phosphate aminotransferase
LPDRLSERRQRVAAERERLALRLDQMGIAYHPSEANFLLVKVTGLGIPGPEVAQALLERGVLTRSGYAMECPGWIRVTIGDAEESDLFLTAMAELRDAPNDAVHPQTANGLSAEYLSPES